MVVDSLPAVTVYCLGNFRLEINGRAVAHWRAGKARALFQYLLVNRGRLVHRDRLHEVLWPDRADRTSSSLKVAVHAVRRVLAAYPHDDGFQLIHQDHGYLLQARHVWVDLEEFEQSFQQGRDAWAAGDHQRALEWFQTAADLYTGDFLAGETGDWVNEQRQWAQGIALRVLAALRADALEREDWPAAMHWCRRIIALDPYHEDTYQTLMMIHGELGELGRARDWYELCRRRLRKDLDAEPAERTERILASLTRRRRPRTPALAGLPTF